MYCITVYRYIVSLCSLVLYHCVASCSLVFYHCVALHCIAMQQITIQVANVLTINGVMDVLCLCVSSDDKSHVIWTSIIQLVTSLLVTVKHMFIPHAIDFIGVHQETILSVCINCVM